MGYWNQKHLELQEQETLIDLVNDYLNLYIPSIFDLNFTAYRDDDNVIIEFDEDSADLVKTTFKLKEGNKLIVNSQELYLGYSFYDDEEFDSIISQTETFIKLKTTIENIKKLLLINSGEELVQKLLNNQCYVNAISTLETFLSEKLINEIFNNSEYKKQFVLTHPAFKEMKFNLSEIFKKIDDLDDIVKKLLLEQIYHNLPVVSNIYKSTLFIIFPDIGDMMKAISIRHDLVHRNGKTKEGVEINILKEDVEALCDNIINFASLIEEEIESSKNE